MWENVLGWEQQKVWGLGRVAVRTGQAAEYPEEALHHCGAYQILFSFNLYHG